MKAPPRLFVTFRVQVSDRVARGHCAHPSLVHASPRTASSLGCARLARFPFERKRSNDKKSCEIKMLEQVLIAKVYQLLRNLLLRQQFALLRSRPRKNAHRRSPFARLMTSSPLQRGAAQFPSPKKKHNAGAPSNAAVVVIMIGQNHTTTAWKIAFRGSVPSYSRACGAESISAVMPNWIPKSVGASTALANPNGCNGNTRTSHAERIID